MDVRDLRPEEAADAVALWAECGLTRPWNDPRADLARALDGPTSTVLAAVEAGSPEAGSPAGGALVGSAEGGALVGTAMVGYDGHRGWVYYLAVRDDRRRAGVGRVLMAACEQWLRDRRVPKIQLMVRHGNDAALGFYEALGYADQETVVLGRFLDPVVEARRRAGVGEHG